MDTEKKITSYSIHAQRYYFKNKERIAEKIRLTNYQGEYYKKNRELILMRRKETRERKKAEAAAEALAARVPVPVPASPVPASSLGVTTLESESMESPESINLMIDEEAPVVPWW